jgi:hypothetical protein
MRKRVFDVPFEVTKERLQNCLPLQTIFVLRRLTGVFNRWAKEKTLFLIP